MDISFLQSLLDPGAYPEKTETVELRQTHVSFLLFTDRHVYKVKKPVSFGFLDFTSLDRRRFYCNEEIRLNSRLSPDLYEGVVELRSDGGKGSFRGEGEIVDYAVRMKRLPDRRMLNVLVREGRVGEPEMRDLAGVIAAFHAAIPRDGGISRHGRPEAVRSLCEENLAALTGFVGKTVSAADLRLLHDHVTGFLRTNAGLFSRRVDEGFIRECDGDLHLQNICLTDRFHIFDCIEFSERYRCCDTASDLAFLLMDLEFHGRRDLAAILQEEYLRISGDSPGALLRFYRIYRALVRGKVESMAAADPLVSPAERAAATENARRHLLLARAYVLSTLLPPTLVLLHGVSGSGKSTIAAELSFRMQCDWIRSDTVRKELAGVPVTERGPGEIYAPAWTEKTYGEMLARAKRILSRGESVVVDATFLLKERRKPFLDAAEEAGAAAVIVCAEAPEDDLRRRLGRRGEETAEVSDATSAVLPIQESLRERPTNEEGTVVAVDTTRPLMHNIGMILAATGAP